MEIKCQLDATEVFIADLIACSTCFGHHYAHHQEHVDARSKSHQIYPYIYQTIERQFRVAGIPASFAGGLGLTPLSKHRVTRR
jgi:hypothetical protein